MSFSHTKLVFLQPHSFFLKSHFFQLLTHTTQRTFTLCIIIGRARYCRRAVSSTNTKLPLHQTPTPFLILLHPFQKKRRLRRRENVEEERLIALRCQLGMAQHGILKVLRGVGGGLHFLEFRLEVGGVPCLAMRLMNNLLLLLHRHGNLLTIQRPRLQLVVRIARYRTLPIPSVLLVPFVKINLLANLLRVGTRASRCCLGGAGTGYTSTAAHIHIGAPTRTTANCTYTSIGRRQTTIPHATGLCKETRTLHHHPH
mmetsp:Transcript_10390/g.18753  ORF Transcript_10390/g.18753 Transcript_10390/m.18753 type:complete len:256 (+) Transcript_10390:140-907(+)